MVKVTGGPIKLTYRGWHKRPLDNCHMPCCAVGVSLKFERSRGGIDVGYALLKPDREDVASKRTAAGAALGIAVAFLLIFAQPALAATCSQYHYAGQDTQSASYAGVERYITANGMTLNGGTHVLEYLTSVNTNVCLGCRPEWSQVGQALGTLGGSCGTTTSIKMYFEWQDNTSNYYGCVYGGAPPGNPTLYEVVNLGRLPDGNYNYEGYVAGSAMGWSEFSQNLSYAEASLEASGSSAYICPSVSSSPGYFGTTSSGTASASTVLLLYYNGGWNWWGSAQGATVTQNPPYVYLPA